MDRRAVLEERRNRWMADREASLASETSTSQKSKIATPAAPTQRISNTDRFKGETSPRHTVESQRFTQLQPQPQQQQRREFPQSSSGVTSPPENDDFIDKLTAKLARNLKDEVRKELQMTTHSVDVRDAISEQMTSYLEAELGTHTCKLCSNLMVSPNHTPILLFPCGHTFCKQW